ncbi:aldo-keto reductase [Rhodotorula toruloides]|uniref:Aldo-keto reductase n=1 Tax=Rhodotorula toruloides TaxID=5286 RepID=A0A511KPK7_RHOTO|nr:aldo-keto reductase [Rhodotorula toruloides]
MDQSDLESLLATLRQAQDSDPGAPAQPAQPAQLHRSGDGAPFQQQLNSLLTTLSALPDAGTHAISHSHSHSHSHSQSQSQSQSPAPAALAHPLNSRIKDLSQLTFQEAVPRVNALAIDPHFLEQVEQLWEEQKTFELRQKDERNRYERELRQSGVSPAIKSQRLREWDRRLLVRWAQVQSEQQEKLRALGVPTFQQTTDPTLLKRQERVIDVLVGFLEDRADDAE